MTEYVKKPVQIEAVQWTGENWSEILDLAGFKVARNEEHLLIETDEGTMMAYPGDWIIKGIIGEIYPCKDEVFQATYEQVSPPSEEGAAEPATPAAQL